MRACRNIPNNSHALMLVVFPVVELVHIVVDDIDSLDVLKLDGGVILY